MVLEDWVDRFAFWNGFHPDLQTLLIYGAGIALYTALVFSFYTNISQRDPLHGKLRKGWWGRVVHVAETTFTFPVLSFGYFAVLSLALFVMAKPDRETSDILLLSMACVMGVRFTAHLAERMSNDLAKLLPLGLLAVVVVDPGYLTFAGIFERLAQGGAMLPILVQYFVLFIVVEAGLRGIRALAPGFHRLTTKIDHKRRLSKNAMLRDVAHEHMGGGTLFHHKAAHHDHAPREKTRSFVTLDENMGKPGAHTRMGPATSSARAAPAPASKGAPGGYITLDENMGRSRAREHMGPAGGADAPAHRPSPRGGPGSRA